MAFTLTNEMQQILTGFSTLNPGIVFEAAPDIPPPGVLPAAATASPTDAIRTVSLNEEVTAVATLPPLNITGPAGVGNIDQFLGNTSLFTEAVIDTVAVDSKWRIIEGDTTATDKSIQFDYTDVESITTPGATNPDIESDIDVTFTLSSNDLEKLKTAIALDKSNNAIAYQSQIESYYEDPALQGPDPEALPSLPDTEEGQYEFFNSATQLESYLNSVQEYLDTAQNERPTEPQLATSTYSIKLAGVFATQLLSMTLLKDGEETADSYTITGIQGYGENEPDPFGSDFEFILDADNLNVIADLTYEAKLSSNFNTLKLTTTIDFNETNDRTDTFNSELSTYETWSANKDANDELLVEAEQTLTRDAINSAIASSTSVIYPSEGSIATYAESNLGYDPDWEVNNPEPSVGLAYEQNTTFTSGLIYWISATYQV